MSLSYVHGHPRPGPVLGTHRRAGRTPTRAWAMRGVLLGRSRNRATERTPLPQSGELHGCGLLAVDLGTARTVVFAPDRGVLIDEPTVLAVDGEGPVAAGDAALEAGAAGMVRLRRPVRSGQVADPVACVQFLTLLLQQHGLRAQGQVMMAVPAVASDYETSVLSAVLSSATGTKVTPVPTLLAAAAGLGLTVDAPAAGLIVDVGAGVVEAGAVGRGRLLAHHGSRIGPRGFLQDSRRSLRRANTAVTRVTDGLPPALRAEFAGYPVHLVGGGALLPGLAGSLERAIGSEVQVQDDARTVVVRGLAVRGLAARGVAERLAPVEA